MNSPFIMPVLSQGNAMQSAPVYRIVLLANNAYVNMIKKCHFELDIKYSSLSTDTFQCISTTIQINLSLEQRTT